MIAAINRADKTLSQLYGVDSVSIFAGPNQTVECIVYLMSGASINSVLLESGDLDHLADAVQDFTTSSLVDKTYPIHFEVSL